MYPFFTYITYTKAPIKFHSTKKDIKIKRMKIDHCFLALIYIARAKIANTTSTTCHCFRVVLKIHEEMFSRAFGGKQDPWTMG